MQFPSMVRPKAFRRRLVMLISILVMTGCRAGGCAAGAFGDLVGQTGDVACDRRYVVQNGEPAAFCQEVIDTVAISQVWDDCEDKHLARPVEGRCPRERVLGGCKVNRENDDGSQIYDWYYAVDEPNDEHGTPYESRVTSVDDVKAQCSDPTRYENGAEFVTP
jgi:hypothetical protein